MLTAGELLDSNRALHPSLSQWQAFKERWLEGKQLCDRWNFATLEARLTRRSYPVITQVSAMFRDGRIRPANDYHRKLSVAPVRPVY